MREGQTTKALGDWGERVAAQYLNQRGFSIVESNYRCPYGEIDLIVQGWGFLAFVEVKLRKSARYGAPAEYVGKSKQGKLRKTALHYLQRHPTSLQPRFDVLEIYGEKGKGEPLIYHIENAF